MAGMTLAAEYLGDYVAASGVYWFLVRTGMIAGFFTAWPVNTRLIRAGIKEAT